MAAPAVLNAAVCLTFYMISASAMNTQLALAIRLPERGIRERYEAEVSVAILLSLRSGFHRPDSMYRLSVYG